MLCNHLETVIFRAKTQETSKPKGKTPATSSAAKTSSVDELNKAKDKAKANAAKAKSSTQELHPKVTPSPAAAGAAAGPKTGKVTSSAKITLVSSTAGGPRSNKKPATTQSTQAQ